MRDVGFGSKPDLRSRSDHVRFAPDTDRIADIAEAKSGPIAGRFLGLRQGVSFDLSQ
jgi:hypothetical protein